MKFWAIILSILIFVTGCATASKDIPAQHVSHLRFQDHSCDQLVQEEKHLSEKVAEFGVRLDKAADNDKIITGVGAVLFWPALFALGGTKDMENEYGRLKGEYEVLMETSAQKNCDIVSTLPQEIEKQEELQNRKKVSDEEENA